MIELDYIDRALLDLIQSDFPLSRRPYADLGKSLGLTEAETLGKIRALRRRGFVRRIGANFSSRRLGFVSTLCAARVGENDMEKFTTRINRETGITHNYLRDHGFNVWFTLIAPSHENVKKVLSDITTDTGVHILNLPSAKVFKIKVDFPMAPQKNTVQTGMPTKTVLGENFRSPPKRTNTE